MKWQNGRRSGNVIDNRAEELEVENSYYGTLRISREKSSHAVREITPVTLNERCKSSLIPIYMDATAGNTTLEQVLPPSMTNVIATLLPFSCAGKLRSFFQESSQLGLLPDYTLKRNTDNLQLRATRFIDPFRFH